MPAKRPRPPECPICTSREVAPRGWPLGSGIMVLDARGSKREPKPTLKPKGVRYRCKQCGHKFTWP